MKETLEKLWNEYFVGECALMDTKEERAFVQKAVEMRKTMDELLTETQREAVEKYIEVLYGFQDFCVKKAFFKGCEFTIHFFFEAGNFEA